MDALLAILPLAPTAVLLLSLGAGATPLWLAVLLSICGFLGTSRLVDKTKHIFAKRGFSGKDLGKKGTPRQDVAVPEALGIVPAVVYLCCVMVLQLVAETVLGVQEQKDAFFAAMHSICFMTLLGFMDDTLDLPWRVKIVLPAVGCGPLLSSYSGSTAVVVPTFLRFLLSDGSLLTSLNLGYQSSTLAAIGIFVEDQDGALVEFGYWFYLLMALLIVFCTNAINIYAGINGIEAGQSYIVGVVILILNLTQIAQGEEVEHATLSALLVLPFIGVTAGLLRHNWYPADVFVGDTFCYFAGMVIAVCAIHGHYAKTLAFILVPQLFNFLFSLPQLFKIIPCPRHRLPRVDEETQLLHPSTFTLKAGSRRLVRLLALVPQDVEEVPNFTIICAALRMFGPKKEKTLVIGLLVLQFVCGVVGIVLRYSLSGICYNHAGGYKCG